MTNNKVYHEYVFSPFHSNTASGKVNTKFKAGLFFKIIYQALNISLKNVYFQIEIEIIC